MNFLIGNRQLLVRSSHHSSRRSVPPTVAHIQPLIDAARPEPRAFRKPGLSPLREAGAMQVPEPMRPEAVEQWERAILAPQPQPYLHALAPRTSVRPGLLPPL